MHQSCNREDPQYGNTDPADDIIVIGKVRFAFLAPEYLIGSEIDVVRKTHGDLYRLAFPLPPTSQGKSWRASSTR